MSFEGKLQEKIDIIDRGLAGYLQTAYPEEIYEAMGYSIFSGGKRLRPVILLAACQMLGGKISNALPFACALEMIHTYSLIHDDLPGMDNDDMRRGRPTNHRVYGVGMAILAGDALLNRAYEVMTEHCVNDNSLHNLKAMAVIAKCAGIDGMIGGQVMDISLEGGMANEQELDFVYTNKTAKLFMAAFAAGAYAAGAAEDVSLGLRDMGRKLGIAFQIKDDLLDITGGEAFGKPIGSDARNKKTTYITRLGVKGAEELFRGLSDQAIHPLKRLENSEFLVTLAEGLINRTK